MESGDAARAESAIAPGSEVTGVVTCHERIAILPTYRLAVRLERSDGSLVARTDPMPVDALPCQFSLRLDEAAARSISPDDVLALRAELTSADTTILRTDSPAFVRVGELLASGSAAPELVLSRGR